MTTKRLYEVKGRITVYVLAEDAAEAQRVASSDVPRCEPENFAWMAEPVQNKNAALAWGPACLVYGADEETKLGDAVKRYVEAM